MIDGVIITPLRVIDVQKGNVYHALKAGDKGYHGFGEAYFSTIEQHQIKAWKRHFDMFMNLVVPIGSIRFVLYDDRENSITYSQYQEVIISTDYYVRLTVPPMVWLGFKGMSKYDAFLLNISNIPHNPNEVEKKEIDEINFDWR